MTGMPPRFNFYDYTDPCEHEQCYDFSGLQKYFNIKDVREAMGVKDEKLWAVCNMEIIFSMKNDFPRDMSPEVEYLMERKYPLIIYAGDLDFLCHYRGIEKWAYSLKWDNQ